jgi:hypothetical protein
MAKDNKLKKDYFYQAARDCYISLKEYFKGTDCNYVIVEDGVVIVWASNQCPVIFGDKGDALNELGQWCGEIRNVSIITEREMLETYCKKEYEEALVSIDGEVMDTTNNHDEGLVEDINRAWRKGKERFKPILCALYERDIDEITDSDAFRLPRWESTREYQEGMDTEKWDAYNAMALKDMQEHWEDYASNYLQHIADDGDLECVISFLHYPYLLIYE